MLIDVIFILLLVAAAIKGMRKGMIMAAFKFFGYLLGLLIALKFSNALANYWATSQGEHPWIPLVSFLVLFLLVAFAVTVAGKALEEIVQAIWLGWLNKLSGAFIYMLLYALLFSVALYFADRMQLLSASTKAASKLYPLLAPLAPGITDGIGNLIPFFKNLFTGFERFLDGQGTN
jgi:membrane protein required for colicin V production